MANNTRRRPQTQKQRNSGSDPNRLALALRNGDGGHRMVTDYQRRPKHRHQGWGE